MNFLSRAFGLLMAFILAALILTVLAVGAVVFAIITPIAILGFVLWFCYQIMGPYDQKDDDKPP